MPPLILLLSLSLSLSLLLSLLLTHALPLIGIIPRPSKLSSVGAISTRIDTGRGLGLGLGLRGDVRRVVGGEVGVVDVLRLGLGRGVEVLCGDLEGGLHCGSGGGGLDGGLGVYDAVLRGVQGAGAVEVGDLVAVGLGVRGEGLGAVVLDLGLGLGLGEGVAVLGLRVWAGGLGLGLGLDGGCGGAFFGFEFLDARFGGFEFFLHLFVFGEFCGG